jgi:hypothetical protein
MFVAMDVARIQEVNTWLGSVLLASVLADPRQPGLSREEIVELAERRGYGRGEVFDALRSAPQSSDRRYMPVPTLAGLMLVDFNEAYADDPRNFDAFCALFDQFELVRKEHGIQAALPPRDVLVERAAAKDNIPRHDIEGAIASILAADFMKVERDGRLRMTSLYAHPKQQRQHGHRSFGRTHPIRDVRGEVEDVVRRRTDGRNRSADPYRAFAETMQQLALEPFVIWWLGLANELKTLDPQMQATCVLTQCAALLEGALTMSAMKARERGIDAFGANIFSDAMSTWKLLDLINAAERAKIFDKPTADTLRSVNADRKRIHVGSLLAIQNPTPQVLDYKAANAESARLAADNAILAIAEWWSTMTTAAASP